MGTPAFRDRPGRGAPGIDPLLDHLVFATPDLAEAVAEFEAMTGLCPIEGGRHLGLGTRNYLVGLGPTSYLEIIGPDTEHPPLAGVGMPFGVDQLTAPRLLTWAVHPPDIDAAVRVYAGVDVDLGAPKGMSRRTPSGEVLKWRLATAVPLPFGGVTPFLIDWGLSTHPGADPHLPTAGLVELSGTHPDPPAVQRVLDALAVALPVETGEPGLRAVLDTPNGQIILNGAWHPIGPGR